jgi:hypothetical protein
MVQMTIRHASSPPVTSERVYTTTLINQTGYEWLLRVKGKRGAFELRRGLEVEDADA